MSPLVDIRSRLVDQATVEVFTVRSPQRSYWRLTSLEEFDGTIWKSSGSFGSVDGSLPASVEADVATSTFEQSFTISSLASIWLPSAYEPRAVDAPGVDVRYDEDSATLIVDDDVTRQRRHHLPGQLRLAPHHAGGPRGASGEVPSDIRDRFLELPDGFSPSVRALAQEITDGIESPADQARALQDHLRDNFTYSLAVQRGHSEDALEDFLFTNKEGYCEQFAGAFAAMARSIGLPARVAVGFTPGSEDDDEPGLYHVRGEYAHAWPEVYIQGAGWVLFEPTPGRGAPGAEGYTGRAGGAGGALRPRGHRDRAQHDDHRGVPRRARPPPHADRDPFSELDASADGSSGGGTDSAPVRYLGRPLARAAPVVAILVVAYAILFPLGLLLWRSRRRRRADSPLAQVELAWIESVEDAGLLGYEERASDTYFERAHHLAAALPGAEDAAFALARAREAAAYSAAGATEDDARAAQAASDELRELAREQTPWLRRVGRWIDPRSLVRVWRRDHAARQRRITLTARGDLEQERELVGSSDRG